SNFTAPHPGGVDYEFGVDHAAIGDGARHAASLFFKRGDAGVLHDFHAAGAGAGSIRVREARRVDVAVTGDPGSADDAGALEQRKQVAGLTRGDEVDVESETL